MKINETSLPGVFIVEQPKFNDNRGFLTVPYEKKTFTDAGIKTDFVQDNHSRSGKGVLRGLHFQAVQAQSKLVRVTRGAIFDVAVDIRAGSPTFGQWVGAILSEENNTQIFVPKNFAHGFYVLSDVVDVLYKVDDYYHPQSSTTIRWDDPDIGIEWPLDGAPILSEVDQNGQFLKDFSADQLPQYKA